MLISIIIPVYNAEKYLSKCLESIKNQTYKEIEVILVNDGSTDSSAEICNKYSQLDSRFKVIHKKNEGVSIARNIGIKHSKGRYLGFVDPDDWIEPNMIYHLYNLILEQGTEMAICGYYKEKVDGTIINDLEKENITLLDYKDAINMILENGFVWNKLFSKNIINKYNISFNEHISFCEDLLFCCEYLIHIKKVSHDTKYLYHYVIHNDNITSVKYNAKKLTSLDALNKIIELLENTEGINLNKYKNNFMHMNISLLMNGLNQKACSREEKKYLKKNLYKFHLSSLLEKNVKLSCFFGRISIYILFYIWKYLGKGKSIKL